MIVTATVRNIIVAIMAALVITLLSTLLLYRGAVHDRDDYKRQNTELTDSLTAERAWSAKLSTELAARAAKQQKSNADKAQAEQKLDESYEKNPDWADAPVPDDVADGLSEFLQTR